MSTASTLTHEREVASYAHNSPASLTEQDLSPRALRWIGLSLFLAVAFLATLCAWLWVGAHGYQNIS
jgi:hypothetical protein